MRVDQSKLNEVNKPVSDVNTHEKKMFKLISQISEYYRYTNIGIFYRIMLSLTSVCASSVSIASFHIGEIEPKT